MELCICYWTRANVIFRIRYRVFECEGQAPEDLVILALQQAVTDKVDIIGLSLGVPTYWEVDDPFAATTTNLEVLGIIVVAANGNSYVPGLPSSREF